MLCDAVRRGDITWHALPFTMHSELADDAFFRRSLAISQELDGMTTAGSSGGPMQNVLPPPGLNSASC